jgi:DNA mismatch repair protein MutH
MVTPYYITQEKILTIEAPEENDMRTILKKIKWLFDEGQLPIPFTNRKIDFALLFMIILYLMVAYDVYFLL